MGKKESSRKRASGNPATSKQSTAGRCVLDDRIKKAFDFAADSTKQLLTLATGITALTITFSKNLTDTAAGSSGLIIWAWIIYLVSILCGLWTLLALTGSLERASTATIYGANVRLPSLLQVLTFAVATVLIIWFAASTRGCSAGDEASEFFSLL